MVAWIHYRNVYRGSQFLWLRIDTRLCVKAINMFEQAAWLKLLSGIFVCDCQLACTKCLVQLSELLVMQSIPKMSITIEGKEHQSAVYRLCYRTQFRAGQSTDKLRNLWWQQRYGFSREMHSWLRGEKNEAVLREAHEESGLMAESRCPQFALMWRWLNVAIVICGACHKQL